MSKLACNGGTPVYSEPWPKWPPADRAVEQAVLKVLRSGRWAISGMSTGCPSEERHFGSAFAQFIGLAYGVPVVNGSAALVVALEALGIGDGDEVLVPGLVWVACASAVSRVGAVPILVDVEKDTFCMSPLKAKEAISSRTKAILLVHLYSSMADIDAFLALSKDTGIPILEDCSQAHGARWRSKRAGSFGEVSAFSFQNSKLLTAGEGGIVLMDSPELYDAAQQLRSDGRRWKETPPVANFPDLDEVGNWQGHNYCMTEIQAAILSASLPHLDEQNYRRAENALRLEAALADVGHVKVVRRRDDRVSNPTFYHLPIRIDSTGFGGAAAETVRLAVQAELGLFLEPVDAPLNSHVLYQPFRSRRFNKGRQARLDVSQFRLPVASELSRACFTIPHQALLAPSTSMYEIAEAFAKVKAHVAEL